MSSSAAAAAIRSRRKRAPATMPVAAARRQPERVDRVEEVLLVLLHVLVVGQRERVHHAVQGGQMADDARRLGPQELGRVGVLLLGHDRRAARPGVGQLDEAELLRGPQHELGPQARQVRRAGGRGAQVVQDEVAVGDRVDRVGRDALEAELGRHRAAIGVEVDPGQRARPERQRRRLLGGEAQARAVALEHPHVGQQVMAEVDGLRALQVRVARQRPVEVALGGVDQRGHERGDRIDAGQRRLAREERDVGRHLVVARARGVQPAAHRARQLGEPPLDGHVDVLVVGREREAALAQLGLDGVQAGQQRVAILVPTAPPARPACARARATARRHGATGADRSRSTR